jgi:hypothetical protein
VIGIASRRPSTTATNHTIEKLIAQDEREQLGTDQRDYQPQKQEPTVGPALAPLNHAPPSNCCPMRKIREPDIGCRVSLRLSWCVAIPQHVTERTPEIPARNRAETSAVTAVSIPALSSAGAAPNPPFAMLEMLMAERP